MNSCPSNAGSARYMGTSPETAQLPMKLCEGRRPTGNKLNDPKCPLRPRTREELVEKALSRTQLSRSSRPSPRSPQRTGSIFSTPNQRIPMKMQSKS